MTQIQSTSNAPLSKLSVHRRPIPTDEQVKDAAKTLIGQSPSQSTTNLDIKQHLRKLGYQVTQAVVSDAMVKYSDVEDEFTYNFNGQYRTYQLADDSTASASPSPSQPQSVVAGLNIPVVIPPPAKQKTDDSTADATDAVTTKKKSKRPNPIADWTCGIPGIHTSQTYLNCTRSQARYRYVKDMYNKDIDYSNDKCLSTIMTERIMTERDNKRYMYQRVRASQATDYKHTRG